MVSSVNTNTSIYYTELYKLSIGPPFRLTPPIEAAERTPDTMLLVELARRLMKRGLRLELSKQNMERRTHLSPENHPRRTLAPGSIPVRYYLRPGQKEAQGVGLTALVHSSSMTLLWHALVRTHPLTCVMHYVRSTQAMIPASTTLAQLLQINHAPSNPNPTPFDLADGIEALGPGLDHARPLSTW